MGQTCWTIHDLKKYFFVLTLPHSRGLYKECAVALEVSVYNNIYSLFMCQYEDENETENESFRSF